MKHEDFRKEQIKLQLDWRQRHPEISTDYGFQNGKPHPHIVPKSEWEKTIWEQIRCPLLEYLKKVQHHSGTNNLLSSWVLCSNLYFGTNTDAGLKELFRLFLQKKLNIKIEVINEVYIEFALDGELSPSKLLGEPEDGKRGANQTSPDVAVSFTTNGKNGLILIECKYTEHSFYPCSGKNKKGQNPNPARCVSKDTLNNFKTNCHQCSWGRKYWDYLTVSEYGLQVLKYCPSATGGYQLVRQQALAEGIKINGNYERVFSCIAFDARNESLMKSMNKVGVKSIDSEFGKLFNLKSEFATWTHQEWVGFVKERSKSRFEKDWVSYIVERYNI